MLFGEIELVSGLEEASEMGRDPERGEIGCWLRVYLWHTTEVILFMLGGTLRSFVCWGDSPRLRPVSDENLEDTGEEKGREHSFRAGIEHFLIEYDCRLMQPR